MKNQSLKLLVSGAFLLLGACTTGNCRQQAKVEQLQKDKGDAKVISVYKYDGSKQCGMGKKIDVEAMKSELGEIQTFSATRKSDGLIRTQVCGSDTGFANVYEIDVKDLEKAKAAGFEVWSFN